MTPTTPRIQITTPEGDLSALIAGEGRTIVFVHGTPSSSFEFRHLIERLHGTHRCVAVDHLGFGQSDKPPAGDYSLLAHQRRFSETMATLEVDDALFVLHDFGTAIALPWMLSHPEKVRGVLLCNTFLWPATGMMRGILAMYATALGRWFYRWANLSTRFLLPWAWGRHQPLTPELHKRYLAAFPRSQDRHATSALPGELIGPTLTQLASQAPRLAQWPVRAVWGMADPLVGPTELARWQELLPNLQVDTVPLAGHFVADEAPDAILRAIQAFESEPR
jgi:pimeloyl-ACP methyl ester carboxylesterase